MRNGTKMNTKKNTGRQSRTEDAAARGRRPDNPAGRRPRGLRQRGRARTSCSGSLPSNSNSNINCSRRPRRKGNRRRNSNSNSSSNSISSNNGNSSSNISGNSKSNINSNSNSNSNNTHRRVAARNDPLRRHLAVVVPPGPARGRSSAVADTDDAASGTSLGRGDRASGEQTGTTCHVSFGSLPGRSVRSPIEKRGSCSRSRRNEDRTKRFVKQKK